MREVVRGVPYLDGPRRWGRGEREREERERGEREGRERVPYLDGGEACGAGHPKGRYLPQRRARRLQEAHTQYLDTAGGVKNEHRCVGADKPWVCGV